MFVAAAPRPTNAIFLGGAIMLAITFHLGVKATDH